MVVPGPTADRGQGPGLDAVYSGTVLDPWQAAFHQRALEFRRSFLGSLLPFQSNPALAAQFDKMFDGTEVLPEDLVDEYLAVKESDRSLEADHLLVPISWGTYHQLASKGLLFPGDGDLPPIARLPYDPTLGLQLPDDP